MKKWDNKSFITSHSNKATKDHEWLREFGDENESLNKLFTLVFMAKNISRIFVPQLYFKAEMMAFHSFIHSLS